MRWEEFGTLEGGRGGSLLTFGSMTSRRWACAGILAGTLAFATPAWSQTYVGVTPPVVVSDSAIRPDVASPVPTPRSDIAVTGADIAELVAIGAFGVSAGALGARVGRRRVTPEPV